MVKHDLTKETPEKSRAGTPDVLQSECSDDVNRTKLNICLISEDFPGEDGCGGIGTYTHILARGLRELGNRVHVITRTWERYGVENSGGVFVHRVPLPEPKWRGIAAHVNARFGETRQILRWNQSVNECVRQITAAECLDVIESPDFHSQGLFVAAFRRRPLLIVVRLHGSAYYSRYLANLGFGWSRQDTWLSERLERELVRRAHLVLSASQTMATHLTLHWNLDPSKIHILPIPIDDDMFRTPAGKERDAGTLLYVGRISQAKGLTNLIDALPAIAKGTPGIRLRLVGREDPSGYGDFLRQRARQVGVQESSIEFTGPIHRAALGQIYAGASICVLPTPLSSGYSCLEAMAAGCAVVAGVSPRGHALITHGIDGILVHEDDPETLAAAIRQLLSDPDLRYRLGDRARSTVRECYGRMVISEMTVRAYLTAMAKKKG